MSVRRFRFCREAARASWYIGPALHASMVLLGFACGFLTGTPLGWGICTLLIAFWVWHWCRQKQREAAFWKARSELLVWLEDGRLWVSGSEPSQPESEKPDWVQSIDALVENDRIVRLLVDGREGRRRIYAGYHDMDAFAAEFRRNVPWARFRRVRWGFSMRLKEV